jgi:hypothetical protein
MSKEGEILKQAIEIARSVESWADLSNALYNAEDGLLTRTFPTRAERERFTKTKEYAQIRDLISDAVERFGLVEGATPKKSGKFVVRVPQSLHAALEREANSEGVSLNQLVVTKLAVQLHVATSKPKPRRKAPAERRR